MVDQEIRYYVVLTPEASDAVREDYESGRTEAVQAYVADRLGPGIARIEFRVSALPSNEVQPGEPVEESTARRARTSEGGPSRKALQSRESLVVALTMPGPPDTAKDAAAAIHDAVEKN